MRRNAALLLLVLACACSSSSTRAGMRARAADEWNCPEEAIQVTEAGQNAYRVTGCGRSAYYDCSGGGGFARGQPQTNPQAEQEYRFMGAGDACYKASRD